MLEESTVENFKRTIESAFDKVFNVETILVFIFALAVAYLVTQGIEWIVVHVARYVSHAEDTAESQERMIQLRRIETYLSVSLAIMRFFVFAVAMVAAWQFTHPQTATTALVGASTVFVVLAGATIVPMLRDLTAGSVMIAEQWYNVGDYITVLPFAEVDGVVEQMNLRSTKIRSLSGEIVWVHNQHIQGIKVTPKGVRTIAIDVFVNNLSKGEAMVQHVAQTLPVSPTMLATPFEIVHTQKLGDRLWQITAIAQTAPGREWLLENFAREAMEEYDKKAGTIIVHGPIARSADEVAERRFKRIIRIKAPVAPTDDPARDSRPKIEKPTSTKK